MTSAEYINSLFEENEELKAKIEALQNGTEVCWQGDMDRTIAQNLELKEQVEELKTRIEKMKCCSNCSKSKYGEWCGDYHCASNNKWEMKK